MSRRSSASFRLWLVAALFGLSALLPTGAAHARKSARPLDVSGAHSAQDAATTPASGAELFAPVHLRGISHPRLVHALPRTSAPAPLLRASCLIAPRVAKSLPARENVTALSGVLRTPGPSRAPPVA